MYPAPDETLPIPIAKNPKLIATNNPYPFNAKNKENPVDYYDDRPTSPVSP